MVCRGDCTRCTERICLCRLHTHYNLGKHIRSLSPYTKLSLIMDTALWLFCSLFPSPPSIAPRGVYPRSLSPPSPSRLPYRPTLSFPSPVCPHCFSCETACQEPWQVCIHHHGAGHTARSAQTVYGRRTDPPA